MSIDRHSHFISNFDIRKFKPRVNITSLQNDTSLFESTARLRHNQNDVCKDRSI